MKKLFNILLRLWCLRKARKLTSNDNLMCGDEAEVLCANADEIMSYILHGYTPEWRIKKESQDSGNV